MPKRRRGECAYCGKTRRLEDDHIPPKALWAKPRPSDIIHIPSCRRCNGSASLDDEYFKTMMVLKEGAGSHPEAVGIRASVFRGLQMPQKLGFARSIMRNIRPVRVRTQAGLDLGRRTAFDVNLGRLDLVVERITRGLFWHHRRYRVPDGFDVTVYTEDGLRGMESGDLEAVRREVIIPVLSNRECSVGRGVMRYWHAFAIDRAHVSAWVYEFYGDVRFAAIVTPREPDVV